MNAMKRLSLVLLVISFAVGQSQQTPSYTLWCSGGVGLSSVSHSQIHNSLQFSLGLRRDALTVKYQQIRNVESAIHSVIHLSEIVKYPLESVTSRMIQVGYTVNISRNAVPDSITSYKEKNISFSVGVLQYRSISRGQYLGEPLGSRQYDPVDDSGIGLPLEIEYEWRYNNHFGAAAGLHAEINGTQSYIGLMLHLMLGTW